MHVHIKLLPSFDLSGSAYYLKQLLINNLINCFSFGQDLSILCIYIV